ncbi:mechanosensitive ion channel family protein [Cytophagaceae bacterium DM2B3-1]|uniref:Mechanosensitive ion channel family protein n=1 Tax=Xanthocytophaga flava TaxID=3048013 RepID=A0ABT7CJ35_9BACT|nr:mechanosensitive ion channel family protein [Xanthocytophaga flavus]MDJ1493010.1 mechanosensitive ion channel family protein [Xanthocytophaga flavus]
MSDSNLVVTIQSVIQTCKSVSMKIPDLKKCTSAPKPYTQTADFISLFWMVLKQAKLSKLQNRLFRTSFLLFLILSSICFIPTFAQIPGIGSDTADILKTQPEWEEDSLGRRNPRGTVAGFLEAVGAKNYSRASRYLKIDNAILGLSDDKMSSAKTRTTRKQGKAPKSVNAPASIDSVELAQRLQRILDANGNLLPYSWISDEYDGSLTDNLAPNLERVGKATVAGKTFDLLLEKEEGPDGAPIWLLSTQTIAKILLTYQPDQASPLVDRWLPAYLKEHSLAAVPIGYWLALLVLAVIAYLLAWLLTGVIIYLLPFVWTQARQEPTAGVVKALGLPFRILIAVWFYGALVQIADISIIIRQRLGEITTVIGMVAVILLLWRVTVVFTQFSERRIARRGNMAAVSAVLFLSRVAKTAIVAFGLIAILYTLGFDVTTGLAALGIGGIALALGAQKTVENFVGSVALIVDQPIRVGDFCKVGETVGTVEQIGMRSTRIRTLDRTIVTIPNGEFSSQRIENYAHRDRFWFHPVIALHFQTTPDQIRYILTELDAVLKAYPTIDKESARIRFVGIGSQALNLEIFAYVLAKDYNAFLVDQESLLLQIIDTVRASGSSLAFPTQALYVNSTLTGEDLAGEFSGEDFNREGRHKTITQIERMSKARVGTHPNSKDTGIIYTKPDSNKMDGNKPGSDKTGDKKTH